MAAATRDALAALEWWGKKLAATAGFDTDHRKLRDLVEDWKVMMLVQRCAESGAVSPMVNYRGAWVRDSTGPILLFLRLGMPDAARDCLRYFFRATRLRHEVPNHVPLDLDFAPLEGGVATDWSRVAVPPAEVPSWIILQHLWYWRATRDTALIREHWPLLEACIKGQRREQEVLLPFHGDETWLHGALYSTHPVRVGDGSGFIADDGGRDRRAYSFASGVLFLMALNAIGELGDCIDKDARPEAWKRGQPEDAPGKRWGLRGFQFKQELEKRYWLADEGLFAPALSPVGAQPHRAPFADVNLLPLWVGFTFTTGEMSRDNLKNTLARLWRRGVRVGSTPSVGWSCGHLQGKLLVALAERDAAGRLDCIDELLRLAEPAGEWAELYDPEGRPAAAYDPQWPNRCRPWESGVNLDALLYAIGGVRFVSFTGWDDTEIRLEPRLPRGATYVTMRNVRKDGRTLQLYFNEELRLLDEQERRSNDALEPERRRDPSVPHRRLHFRVELMSSELPAKGYWDVAVNGPVTMFPRYLWPASTVIEERDFHGEDHWPFFPADGEAAPPPPVPTVTPGADLMVFTCRRAGAQIAGTDKVTLVDTGLPWTAPQLAALLLADGKPTHPTLLLDWGWNEPGRATFKTAAFWRDPTWAAALDAFRAAGGSVVEARYFDAWELGGTVAVNDVWVDAAEPRAAPGGRLELEPADGAARVRVRFASQARDAVLRIGAGCGFSATLNGATAERATLERREARTPSPDQSEQLVRLRDGENVLEVTLEPGGERVLWARVTDARGLPVAPR